MTYKLGNKSKEKLEGVDERMQAVVHAAIGQTSQDFSVICGLRTKKEQEALVAKGASQTMKSKHLGGYAVDLMAYIDGGRWELNLYDEIADAMKSAAKELGVKLRWGAAWHSYLRKRGCGLFRYGGRCYELLCRFKTVSGAQTFY